MKAVLLAGGLGTRLREETEYRPKPMVEIGERPILWHIMKNLSTQNLTEFIVCLGYKGDMIKDYFLNYDARVNDVTIELGGHRATTIHTKPSEENWKVLLAGTGALTMTGGRIYKIRDHLMGERFLCTYGDGVANIDLSALLEFHTSRKKIATVTVVKSQSRFGAIEMESDGTVSRFKEKPKSEGWINGGFFIFEKEIFGYLDDESVLEREPLENLAKDGQLAAFQHDGFWQPMDTFREAQELNELWDTGRALWKNW
jgi:glucose-1-phosphate cytidylyltransferase